MRLRAGVPALRNELRWAWRRLAFSWRSSLSGTLGIVSGGLGAREAQDSTLWATFAASQRYCSGIAAWRRRRRRGCRRRRVAGALFVNTSRCGRSGGQSRVGVALATPQCCATHRAPPHYRKAGCRQYAALARSSKAALAKLNMTDAHAHAHPRHMLIATAPQPPPQSPERAALHPPPR